MYTCIYIRVYTFTRVYIYVYVYFYIYVYVYICICVYALVYTYANICMYMHVYWYKNIHIDKCKHVIVYIHMHMYDNDVTTPQRTSAICIFSIIEHNPYTQMYVCIIINVGTHIDVHIDSTAKVWCAHAYIEPVWWCTRLSCSLLNSKTAYLQLHTQVRRDELSGHSAWLFTTLVHTVMDSHQLRGARLKHENDPDSKDHIIFRLG